MTTFPINTNIWDVTNCDRSTKVFFSCTEHPQYEYCSKQPSVSQWFPSNEAAQAIGGSVIDECNHTAKDDVWFTTREYTNAD